MVGNTFILEETDLTINDRTQVSLSDWVKGLWVGLHHILLLEQLVGTVFNSVILGRVEIF